MEYIWNITSRCNMNCAYCWDPFKDAIDMEQSECFQMIDRLTENGCSMLIFTGGEALVRNDFFQIVEYAWKAGVHSLKLCTNGLNIVQQKQEVLKSKLDEIHISVNSAKEIQSSRNYNEMKNVLVQLTQSGKKIVFVSTIAPDSLEQYASVLQLAQDLNVYVSCQFLIDVKLAHSPLQLMTLKQRKHFFDQLNSLHTRYIDRLDISTLNYIDVSKRYYLANLLPSGCGAGTKHRVISPDGTIYRCYWSTDELLPNEGCFGDRCLVWFRYNSRINKIYQMMSEK